ncbi:MAG: protein translocase subunit SecDF [Chitinophagaceae bacterium]|nr:protein translocase subunit SecDF [Chitinophagaceae bacterium]
MRALVSIFTLLLIGISLYQLSFTWFVNQHEKEIEAKVQSYSKRNFPGAAQKYPGNKEAQAIYLDSISTFVDDYRDSLLTASKDKTITWWGQSYQKAKESELLLGLDLQGGINVTMDISLDGLIKGLANNPRDPQILAAIAEAQRLKLASDQNFIDLFVQSYKKANPNGKLAPLFANSNRNQLKLDAGEGATTAYLKQEAKQAMAQTFEVLRKRIDKFGVAQPNINLDENKGIITVELAGATDPERVRRYLQSTANLQFWEVYTLADAAMVSSYQNADKALETYLYGTKSSIDSVTLKSIDSLRNLRDSVNVARADAMKKAADSAVLANTKNPLFQVLYPVQPYQDPATGKQSFGASIGRSMLKDTAKVNQYLALPAVKNSFPANVKFLWGKQGRDDKGVLVPALELYAIKTIPGRETAELEGSAIDNASQDFDQLNNVTVSMQMNNQGAKKWADLTGKNVQKPIAIVLDDIVYSAPNVTQKIEGGNSQINMGGGSGKAKALVVSEAQDLANILKSGKLEAPAKIVQEQVVGPTLGAEAVKGGMNSFLLAFAVIFILMVVYYNTAGIVANIALILNLLFTIGVLSALNATLTAPGIAGLVLTIGMAVDTNVIIFERIKEELARGLSHPEAVKLGYRRSLPPVLDAHVTTFMTAAILAYFGLGPVLGFATTQMLGIVLSLFCGILVSRLITDIFTSKNRHFNYFTPISRRIFRHAKYKFIEYRKVAYAISVVVLILGVGAIFHGFNEGVEFSGGRSYIVDFHKPVDGEQVKASLEKTFGKMPVIKTYGNASTLDITTDYKIAEAGLAADSSVHRTLFTGLQPYLPAGLTFDQFGVGKGYLGQTKKVDPTISDDLKKGAQWATFWSLLMIAVYIFIRFRDWRYSLGTIVALLHDVLVTLAVFSFLKDVVPFPLEIDQHFIAAILTVIGFSMNDTVIVFDRVREYSRTMKGASKGEVINKAINDTLSRTIMTSLTVFLTILILFLVGGEVTKGFSFAMLIGIIVGCYSSIFVAAPILVDFAKNKPLGEADFLEHKSTADIKKKPVVLAKKA